MIETKVNACCAGIGTPPILSDFEILTALAAVVGGWGAIAVFCVWYFLGRRK